MIKKALPTLMTSMMLLGSNASAEDSVPIRIAHTGWSSSVASAHLVQAVLQEKLGIAAELRSMEAGAMWRSVAQGEADLLLSAWLPSTHGEYMARYGSELLDLGPNLRGARTGLVVPDVSVGRQTGPTGQQPPPYIKAASINDLRDYPEKFRRRIIGIDSGAGIMAQTREAMNAYGLSGYRLIEGSEVSMTAELSHAIRHQQWIVVTGWTPHWMFARWKLRFLDDPEGVFGASEEIHTLVRPELKKTHPTAYAFLERFSWSPEESSRYMTWNQADGGLYPYEKAQRWIYTHPDQVEAWLEGLR